MRADIRRLLLQRQEISFFAAGHEAFGNRFEFLPTGADVLGFFRRDLIIGGSAGNCSHAVNDFRKIGGFEAYTPVDNVAELTARTNDEGWTTVFEGWLKGSRLSAKDAVFVFSVGGSQGTDTRKPTIKRRSLETFPSFFNDSRRINCN